MNKETGIQNSIMLALAEAGCMVWRNATAFAWVGKLAHKTGDQVTLTHAQPLHAGLCVGSSDIVGIAPNGKFMAVEVKTRTGRRRTEQTNFIDQVRKAGGIAGIARSPAEALELLHDHN